ncbi:MAG TPA: phosphosulfolactate synthase [Symbiobacteriaceae bacterium]|nr:phosphosulfolactate synthase [Symbiobacteriaceae bacterium]
MAESRAFDGVITNPLAGRIAKPRRRGHTMIIDKGLGLSQTGDLLEIAADYVDYIKLTFGTAALYTPALLRAKIALIRSYGIQVYPGGTFFEIALVQGRLDQFLQRSRDLGFDLIEVSDGTIELSPAARREAILRAREYGFPVITEVGKKDGAPLEPDAAQAQIQADLEDGAVKVILEGRESGMGAGIYDRNGQLQADDLEQIVAGLSDPGALMWEAPLKAQQEALILRFGPNVNLGNVKPEDAMALEALRIGLRGDTLRLALELGAL